MDIVKILEKLGPCRSSKLAENLEKEQKISNEAARQRISRTDSIKKFSIPLPNNENFIYLESQRKKQEEIFWGNLHKAWRETNSIYGMAVDGLMNRGGKVEISEFSVISGAPIALKKQVTVDMIRKNFEREKIIKKIQENGQDYYLLNDYIILNQFNGTKHRNQYEMLFKAENILLDFLREWARNIGLASYNKIFIRGEENERKKVGNFAWDLTGPSYLLPLKTIKKGTSTSNPGFFVADVFANGILKEHDIKYFVRKAQTLQSSIKNIKVLSMLMAEGFDSSALKYGKQNGVILASIKDLFGSRAAQGIKTLIEILNTEEVANKVINNPKKITQLLEDLQGCEGNLRGILFELISVYLA